MEINREDKHSKQQHPEAENGQKAHHAAQDEQQTDNDPQERRPGNAYRPATESYCRHKSRVS